MFETIFIFMVTFNMLVGITEGVVVPAVENTVEVTTEVVDTAIDYIDPEETTDE